MKKTTIIQNLTTRFTPNWWVKISTVTITSFLVFISCEDPEALFGFKDENPRFKVRYVEIPLESSQLVVDSVRTQNTSNTDHRLLVGEYSDPIAGKVTVKGIAQYSPPVLSVTVPSTAVLDSAFLTLKTDYYHYGSTGSTEEKFELHELTDVLYSELNEYFSNSTIGYDPVVIGTASLFADAEVYKKEFYDTDADPVVTLKFNLNSAYADRLLHSIDAADTLFTKFRNFRKIFKGLAIVPASNSKVLGFSLNVGETALTLYYHNGDSKLSYSFLLNGGVSYSKIDADRSGTDLPTVPALYQEFYPPNGSRFVQSGSGLITKLNIQKFYSFADTVDKVIFNSAELVIDNLNTASGYAPPRLVSRLLHDNNRFFSLKNHEDSLTYFSYFGGNIVPLTTPGFYMGDDDPASAGPAIFDYSSDKNSYNGYCTSFFQRLFDLKKEGKEFNRLSLFPYNPSFTKSVNRAGFNSDKIKLRIYYTKPVVRTK